MRRRLGTITGVSPPSYLREAFRRAPHERLLGPVAAVRSKGRFEAWRSMMRPSAEGRDARYCIVSQLYWGTALPDACQSRDAITRRGR
ncbi:conserved domain protein (plasmid) [Rhodobacter capsulatus SB 1003]|uniref:Conserved domain protein n=1 Tax=Rhodobacter capsulatus (strain ATCC BAA-309 / NBRC 16581 / SB1003) TaxID=272942 RepID=D5AVE7_RHOCB|nr:conserved domain protein [Rhodobacter capsulatus SB 1003]